ncbi:MAG: hypothetical protein AAGI37_12600 [Planctomycetota bacterium]
MLESILSLEPEQIAMWLICIVVVCLLAAVLGEQVVGIIERVRRMRYDDSNESTEEDGKS